MSSSSEAAGREPFLVLSPHLDDAVFCVWHLLASSHEARVVTVFAGVPEDGFVSTLDRISGATASTERMRKRLADDRRALAAVGREAVHAGLIDAQYRAHRLPDLRRAIEAEPSRFIPLVAADPRVAVPVVELAGELDRYVDRRTTVYASAGIGSHPDHRAVALYGVHLADRGHTVHLYADSPYYLRHGFPSWIGGDGGADAYVDAELAALGSPERFRRRVVELSRDEVDAKIATAKRYETEFEPANKDFGGLLEDRHAMHFEVLWSVRPGAGGSPAS
jgi:GlcNAc-PI de-N-acetylase